ncbi:hypothetical protein OG288_42455 [Streptomyces tauricus]|uniref:SH3b domain-containing protein n=1 Tax=Streptomyces tauricus TaxID=68274 RepID=A0ABZ1JS94_9ACTN|nr:hypothetical protein [Streptomyces tauricus]
MLNNSPSTGRTAPASLPRSVARRTTHRVLRYVLAVGTALPVAVMASPSAHAAPAGTVARASTGTAAYAEFRVDGARIRTGPGSDYSIAGLGYRSHSVTAHCSIAPQTQEVWYYLTDNTTGVRGWSEQTVVYVEGSIPPC